MNIEIQVVTTKCHTYLSKTLNSDGLLRIGIIKVSLRFMLWKSSGFRVSRHRISAAACKQLDFGGIIELFMGVFHVFGIIIGFFLEGVNKTPSIEQKF